MADKNSRYVVLEGIEFGNKFFSINTPGKDPTLSAKGEVWYRVIGYADTSEEAQRILFPTIQATIMDIAKYCFDQGSKFLSPKDNIRTAFMVAGLCAKDLAKKGIYD